MHDQNPYAPPATAYSPQPVFNQGGIWRDGNTLIMQKHAVLPDVCLKRNVKTEGYRLKRKLSWHHPALFLLVLISLPIYAILAIILSKKAVIHIGLCEHWRRKRLTRILIAWATVLFSITGFFTGIALADGQQEAIGVPMLLVSIVFFFVGILFGLMGARMIHVKHIDDQYVRFNGAHPEFLAQFPQFGFDQPFVAKPFPPS